MSCCVADTVESTSAIRALTAVAADAGRSRSTIAFRSLGRSLAADGSGQQYHPVGFGSSWQGAGSSYLKGKVRGASHSGARCEAKSLAPRTFNLVPLTCFSMRRLLIVALSAVAIAGCKGESREDVLAQDSSLARDLALANQDTASVPQLADVPATAEPAPVVAEPEPLPAPTRRRATPVRRPVTRAPVAPPEPEVPSTRVTESGNTETVTPDATERALGVVSVGSEITLASSERVCTNTNKIGDRFAAQISNAVMGANGTVIPAGATAVVSVSSLKKSQRAGDDIVIGLRVESITFDGRTYSVSSETTYAEVDRVRAQSRGDDAKKVAAGAAIGAVLGQILGGKTKSTIIGAGAGAAAGAVVANRNADYEGCVPNGGRITIRLSEPLTIQRT